MKTTQNYYALLLAALLLLLTSGCVAGRPPVPPGEIPEAKQVTVSDEQYGHTVFTALTQEFELDYDHPRYDEVMDTVEKLTKGIEADNQQWHVYVFKHPTFRNAAATRGNRIFIWTAMIDATQSQGELAAILAHEIAHVLAGHTEPDPQEEVNKMLIGLGALAAGIAVAAVTKDPTLGENLGQLTSSVTEEIGKGIITNPYSRRLELEADQVGIMIMAKSGFNPEDALSFWSRAEHDPSFSNNAQFFSTHPIAGERLKKLKEITPKAMEVYRNPDSLKIGVSNRPAPQPQSAPTPVITPETKNRNSPIRAHQHGAPLNGVEDWQTVEPAAVYERPDSSSKRLANLAAKTKLSVEARLRGGWLEVSAPERGYVQGVKAEPLD